jgi:hypothetical protein
MGGGGDDYNSGDDECEKRFDDSYVESNGEPVKSYYNHSFNIWNMHSKPIAMCIKENVEKDSKKKNKNDDNNIPLYPISMKCSNNISKKQCALKVRNVTAKYNLSAVAELDLLVLLKDILPNDTNLPLKQSKNGAYVSTMNNCLSEEDLTRGVVDFDICPTNGCAVFVGNDSVLLECPIETCKESRYTTCKQCTKLSNGNATFNNEECQLHHKGRVARKQLTYRCILPIIVKLIVNKTFIQLINFKYYNYINGDTKNKYICDIGDSVAYKEAMEEMKANFEQSKRNKLIIDDVPIDDSTIHVPLLFSIFYDGVQLFKTKSSSYHPLFLTILNLPPFII